jgi:hypothetical protein
MARQGKGQAFRRNLPSDTAAALGYPLHGLRKGYSRVGDRDQAKLAQDCGSVTAYLGTATTYLILVNTIVLTLPPSPRPVALHMDQAIVLPDFIALADA